MLGGTVEFTQDLTNDSNGIIAGRGAIITGNGLSNQGSVALSGGTTDILGDVTNLAGGSVIVSGNSTATFFDDVIHNGSEIRVSFGSTAVYFGSVTGVGPFTGAGTNFFEGDLNPGNSPGVTTFEGNAVFSPTSTLIIELGGLLAGHQYDVVEVGLVAALSGTLRVELYEDFVPRIGDTFEFLKASGGITGTFVDRIFPTVLGVRFDLDFTSTSITLSAFAVPLPAAVRLLTTALGGLLFRLRAQSRGVVYQCFSARKRMAHLSAGREAAETGSQRRKKQSSE